MKIVCIYHSIDLDGWMPAAIVKHWWENSPDAIHNNDDKLDSFLQSEKVKDIDDVQKALLQVQATAMNTYLQCLKERVERL